MRGFHSKASGDQGRRRDVVSPDRQRGLPEPVDLASGAEPPSARLARLRSDGRLCYVDSLAIVKLVVRKHEPVSLRRYLRGRTLVSSALAGVEVTRAVMPHGPRALRTAREELSCIDLVRINVRVLSRAATMDPADLRTLDAIHLATASLMGKPLHRFVCYDGRLAGAANAGNWTAASPD